MNNACLKKFILQEKKMTWYFVNNDKILTKFKKQYIFNEILNIYSLTD